VQLRDRYDEIRAAGADVAAIGMGDPRMAAAFKDSYQVPFPLLVDHRKETYRAAEVKRGNLFEVAGPKVWLRTAKNIVTGKPQGKPQQDAFQLGATAIVERGGGIRYMHLSEDSADNIPINLLLDRLRG